MVETKSSANIVWEKTFSSFPLFSFAYVDVIRNGLKRTITRLVFLERRIAKTDLSVTDALRTVRTKQFLKRLWHSKGRCRNTTRKKSLGQYQ